MDSGERRTIGCKNGVQQGDGMGPPLFCFALVPIVSKYEPKGVRITAYMDDINLNFKGINEETMQVIPDLVDELEEVGIIVNREKSSALLPPGHNVTPTESRLFEDADLPIAAEGLTVVGIPIGTDACVEERAMKKITEGGADELARMLARMPDKQVAHLITSQSLTQRSGYIERDIDHKLTREACERLDNDVMWVLQASMGLRDTADEEEFFRERHEPHSFKLKPYQQMQARLSTGAGRSRTTSQNTIRHPPTYVLPETVTKTTLFYPGYAQAQSAVPNPAYIAFEKKFKLHTRPDYYIHVLSDPLNQSCSVLQ